MNIEENNAKKKIFVIGHKNPDTDSICSAIAYSDLKNRICDKADYVPCRAGIVNEETKFVLDHFGIPVPQYLGTVRPEISDIELNLIRGIESDDSIKVAWELMNSQDS